MYKYILIIIIFAFQLIVTAQIPNGSFEDWTDGEPDNWYANNIFVPGFPQFNLTPVTQSPDAQLGQSALQLEVLLANPGENESVVGAVIISNFFSISQRYSEFKGYFKFFPQTENDSLSISVLLVDDGMAIGSVIINIKETISSYTELSFPFQYFFQDRIPDSASISIGINSNSSSSKNSVGSYALIDNISFDGVAATDVNDIPGNIPAVFEIKQNYPNPFNPSTNIEYSIPEESFVELIIYDILGNEVALIVNENNTAGRYSINFNAENLSSGIYIARIKAGNFIQNIKMNLLK